MVFLRLYPERELYKAQVIRILSGLREKPYLNSKVRKHITKAWLVRWHKAGLITLWRDKVRLGNIALAADLLNKKNKDLLVKQLIG